MKRDEHDTSPKVLKQIKKLRAQIDRIDCVLKQHPNLTSRGSAPSLQQMRQDAISQLLKLGSPYSPPARTEV